MFDVRELISSSGKHFAMSTIFVITNKSLSFITIFWRMGLKSRPISSLQWYIDAKRRLLEKLFDHNFKKINHNFSNIFGIKLTNIKIIMYNGG